MSISLVTPLQMCKTPRCFFLKLMQSERISSFMYILLVKAHIAFLLKFIITFTTYSNLQHTTGSISLYNIFVSCLNTLLKSVVCLRFALVKYPYRYMYLLFVVFHVPPGNGTRATFITIILTMQIADTKEWSSETSPISTTKP